MLDYGSIPVLAAVIGWGTNAVAIWMTFYPLEFRGFFPWLRIAGMPLCGWQGIIPMSCESMAERAVDLMTSRLLDVSGIFGRLDPARVAAELRPALEAVTPKIIETVAVEYVPKTWKNLPELVKKEIQTKCLDDCSQAISGMMATGTHDLARIFDPRDIIVRMFTQDKQLMNDIFLKCAAQEFVFIRVSGFYLGFLFGLVQMFLWMAYEGWWVLPVAGFAVGYLTNWVALQIIFLPVQPRRICGCTWHGLFLKRQKEVASVYAYLFSTRVLTAENLLLGMIAGPCSDDLFAQLDKTIHQGIDSMVRSERAAKMVIGSGEYGSMKARVSELVRSDIRIFIRHLTPYLDEAFNVRASLEAAMRQLSCEEFEGMLHPVFKEGELKLVLIGGFLGIVVGMLQAVIQVPEQLGL